MTKFEMYLHTFEGATIRKNFYKNYIDNIDLTSSKCILEFGCGAGCITKQLLNKVDTNKVKISCLDIDNEAIDLLKKRFKDYDNLNFYVGDIRKLPIKNNSFDTVVVHFMLHDIKETKRLENLKKINNVLSKNGKVFIREPIRENHGILIDELRNLFIKAGFIEVNGEIESHFSCGEMYSALFEKQ
ncbi:MAG: class I SAM-dependent methyltransferase [Pleomorphochaeta sp.]